MYIKNITILKTLSENNSKKSSSSETQPKNLEIQNLTWTNSLDLTLFVSSLKGYYIVSENFRSSIKII